ncbi:uncharacterized protein KY384_000237 [Bacidia gigantensis]|uniref:uncharacterized protein n=1 Tax=Bacidia gigantensis TaxID=2732470 RepID=UPI001D05B1AC|nr:uncharacterized protein KY384_000237 [Bacidia gigantensis]KAG8526244.1 hypothetical protein KY384_000237 [Bacidia gigantensis]
MLNLNFPLRALQAALAIATLGFNGFVTKWYLEHTKPSICPQAPVLLLVVGALTLLSLPYLTFNAPLQITHANRKSNPRFFNKWIVLALDAVLCILWFASTIRLAVFRSKLVLCGGHVCGYMGWGTALGTVAL